MRPSFSLPLTRPMATGLFMGIAAFLIAFMAAALLGGGPRGDDGERAARPDVRTAGLAARIWDAARAHGRAAAPPSRQAGLRVVAPEDASLDVPAVGTISLRVLSPTVLEVTRVHTVPAGSSKAPAPGAFRVRLGGKAIAVESVGFRRRARYAPDRTFDLRISSVYFLRLKGEIPSGAAIDVRAFGTALHATADAQRWSPALHVNQEGYAPAWPKIAMVGCSLGTGGELKVENREFSLLDDGGRTVFTGTLQPRLDGDFGLPVQPYRQVAAADFSAFKPPGRYRLAVGGLGTSSPFFIDDAIGADYARTYALGIYHQRCGADNSLPFTRFVHGACHTAAAQVPDASFKVTNQFLAELARDKDPLQKAPALSDVGRALFPFKRSGSVDVHGGHHDAGDYSKYLINSAQLVHCLVFAVDNFPAVAALDNLGLPESGDGRSDLLQLAKWEADFICRAQDSDGGFYFLVYPREEKYEWNVPPDHGLPQVVFPKNTACSAACTAALAQIASSPAFRRNYPTDAARYLRQARAGFAFLERAWAAHGRRGAYQKVTHYGVEFADRDEIAWAEAEMFLATGEGRFQKMLLADLRPDDPATLRWHWWRLFESYGCAERDVAFAAHSGRTARPDAHLVDRCRAQILACGEEQAAWARGCAYGTSYPAVDKRYGNAAWYFGGDRAFDAAVAYALDPRPEFLETVIGNFNFDNGTNPNNVDFVTGLGWKRQREIVSQYAKNDRRTLPPSGIPIGALTQVEPYLGTYGTRLRELSLPADDDRRNPYPLYDRWTDTWNVQTECVTAIQARCLASAAFLMARSPQAHQAWRAAPASIEAVGLSTAGRKSVTARLVCPGMDLSKATRIVWERSGAEPVYGGRTLTFAPSAGAGWIEAEAQWRDGRRAFAALDYQRR